MKSIEVENGTVTLVHVHADGRISRVDFADDRLVVEPMMLADAATRYLIPALQ